jgi:hypothetical protein
VRQGEWKLVWHTTLPSKIELFDLAQDPGETKDLAAQHPERVAALQRRLEELSKDATKPLFFAAQMKVVMKNMAGEPIMPYDEEQAGIEMP